MEPTRLPEAPLRSLTPRQQELIRFIQALPTDRRHTITIICRGTEPWEIESAVERQRLGELRPRTD